MREKRRGESTLLSWANEAFEAAMRSSSQWRPWIQAHCFAECYFFFVFATFISQVTMLNMLIAIMGDTYARIMENKEVNATMTKLQLLSDTSHTLKLSSKKQDKT